MTASEEPQRSNPLRLFLLERLERGGLKSAQSGDNKPKS